MSNIFTKIKKAMMFVFAPWIFAKNEYRISCMWRDRAYECRVQNIKFRRELDRLREQLRSVPERGPDGRFVSRKAR